jgi:ubiquinol-cytochrome c reductase cytochrome c subunit
MRLKALAMFGAGMMSLATMTLQQPAFAEDIQDGRERYVTYGCWQCHGYEGQGGVAGPRLAPTLLPYVAFEQLVRRPGNVMPAYAPSALSDGDLEAIYAFLQSVKKPPVLEQIPALR